MKLPADGPIPGENYTSDTRNYPWHRPPEISDYDEAVDYMIGKISEPDNQDMIFSLLELKMDIASAVTSLLLQSISKGKIPIDLAILIAGPISRYVDIIAKESGIKAKVTPSNDRKVKITPTGLKMAMGILEGSDIPKKLPDVQPTQGRPQESGLMGMPKTEDVVAASEDEQKSMLGMQEEEPIDGMA